MPITKARVLLFVIPMAIALLIAAGVYRYWVETNGDQNELVLYGNVDLREVEVAFVLQERITHIFVEEGDWVEKGQLLAEIDPVRFQQTVAQRKAELAITEANVQDAVATYRRLEELIKKKP